MTKINSLCLYFISILPLWLAILFIDIKNIVDNDPNLYTERISIISIILIFILSLFIVYYMIHDRRKGNSEKYEIISAKKSKNITIEVFLAYIFPLFAFDFTKWDQVVIFLIFFISLGFLCIKHNYFLGNIVLEILKYDFYECTLKNVDGEIIEMNVISKRKIDKESTLYLKSINNEYMVDQNSKI